MLFFPGGTLLDKTTQGYSFFNNFFSELGRWRSFQGGTQWVSFSTFTIAMLLQSAAIFVFNLQFLKYTNSATHNKYAHWTALISGSVFPFLLAGIGLTPCDLVLSKHMFCVRVGFGLMLPLSIAYTILIRQHHLLPNRYGNVMFLIVIAIALYLLIIFFGPNPREVGYVQQTSQKIIVYTMIGALLYLSLGCLKYLKEQPTRR